MSKEKTRDEKDQAIRDANFCHAVLNSMAAAFIDDESRCALGPEVYWLLEEAEQRMKKTVDFLNS